MLLRHALNLSRAQLYGRFGEKVPLDKARCFKHLLERRIRGEPAAYIVGHREFFGHDFQVDRRVLISRPETELLVETALEFARGRFAYPVELPLIIADIGTGCGAIAISLALRLPQAKIYATDISKEALAVAKLNCEKHRVGAQVDFLWGDMLDPLPEPVHLMVANLPYVKDVELEQLSLEIREFEPRIALAGGPDGLDKIRQLLAGAKGKLRAGGAILVEIGPGQSQEVVKLAKRCFPTPEVQVKKDLGGQDRVVAVEL